MLTGNLIVSKPCLVEQAYVTSINNVPVSSFFTLHTSQTVESQVLFTHVHVMHLYTNFTNGIHFDTDIVLTTADSTIEGMFYDISYLSMYKHIAPSQAPSFCSSVLLIN